MSTDFIKMINSINSDTINLTIEDIYNFRKLNREIYNKAELIGDLNGDLLKVRDIRHINKIGVDLSNYTVELYDNNANNLNTAISDITNILKGFLKRFSYLSSLTYEDSDKYEYYLNMYPLIDVLKCGDSIIISL